MKFTIKLFSQPYAAILWEKVNVTLSLCKDYLREAEHFEKLKPGRYYSVEIKPVREKKTLSQTSYAWELITALSKERKPYMSPIEVYRELVRDFRTYEIIAVLTEAVDKHIQIWESSGKAWFCEILDRGEQWTKVKNIYGMSVWNKDELSDFIDILRQECIEQNIPTERMIEQ